MSVETNWSDQEWAAYLRGSSDPDDQSLALRLALVERLKTRQRLNQREAKLFELLKGMNKAELDFLKAPTASISLSSSSDRRLLAIFTLWLNG